MFILCQTATLQCPVLWRHVIIADVYFVSNRNPRFCLAILSDNYSRCLFCVKPQRCKVGGLVLNHYSRCLFCVKPQRRLPSRKKMSYYSRCLFCVKSQHECGCFCTTWYYSRCLFCVLCRTRTRAERIKIASILHAVEIKPRGVRRRAAGFAVFGGKGVADVLFRPQSFADQL